MQFEGQIHKMLTENANPIRYYLNFSDDFLSMNQLLNQSIKIVFDHYQCCGCQEDKEIYRMGYCKNCFFTLPQANQSIIRPELSTAHLGIEQRDLEWEKEFELQPHIVYLANSSGIKVGVTRECQIPTRWIDQGASEALVIARTENRYQAGMIEVALAAHIADKTNYQRMLKNEIPNIDLVARFQELKPFVEDEFKEFLVDESLSLQLSYPVIDYPTKVKSVTLAKQPIIEGVLKGIKGQYLIFEDQTVFNVRNHEGYYVKFIIQ